MTSERVFVVVQTFHDGPLIIPFTAARRMKDAKRVLVECWAGPGVPWREWWKLYHKGASLSVRTARITLEDA